MDSVISFLQSAAEFSLLGCVEAASVIFVVYYIYAKTRAPAIIAGLFPNLHLNINYRSSLVKFNNIGNELLTTLTLRNGNSNDIKSESKPQNLLAHGFGTQNLLEVTPHAGRKPFHSIFDWGVYLPYVAQSIRIKKYNFPQVSGLVEQDPLLQRTIKQAAEQILREEQVAKRAKTHDPAFRSSQDNENDDVLVDYNQILKRQQRRAMAILYDMRSTLNNFLLSLTSWLLYKLLPCFLSGVVTHTQQIEMLKAAAERSPGIPLIFLPLHRSHLDYIMVTFILANSDIRSPLVAAGNNLQIPVFGGLLRGLGAFFIKRKIDPVVGKKDILYRAILHLYLLHALKRGHNVEFFIEGGRTRTGKPCMPKGGILSIIVNAYMDRSIPDALLVPVSLNYERLVDGNFVREQRGEEKVPESFGKAISGIWQALNSKYGLMRIDFNEPYSIRELVQSYNKIAKNEGSQKLYKPSARTLQHIQSTSSLYGTDVVCEEHRTLIESISRQVVYDCASATSVMSTNALAFLLLTRFRAGAFDKELAKGLDQLRSTLKGRKDMGFSGDSLHIVNYACSLLGKGLIARTSDEQGQVFLRPVPTVESMIELAYYSNSLTPHFALQSILLTTFHALLPQVSSEAAPNTTAEPPGVLRRKLIESALENCEIYRYEYILHKPTQVLESLLEASLDELIMQGLIRLAQATDEPESNIESRRIARNIASYLGESDDDDDGGYVHMEQTEQPDIFLATDTICQQKALCEVLAPFSHAYLTVAQALKILYQNSMLETEFIKFIINDLANKIQNGSCPYAESVSTDSVRNIMKVLEKWSVIEICNQRGLRLVALGTLYETSQDALKTIVQRIAAVVPNYRNGYF